MSKLGIKETKELLVFGLKLGKAGVENLADGYQLSDLTSLIGFVGQAPAALSGIEMIADELMDLQPEELLELFSIVAEYFPALQEDGKKMIALKAVKMGYAACELISAIKAELNLNQG